MLTRLRRRCLNLYNRFTGKHEKAFNKLRDDYAGKCLEFEFRIIEAGERITSLTTALETIAKSSKTEAIRVIANQALTK